MDDDILVANHHWTEDTVELISTSWESDEDPQYSLDQNLHQHTNVNIVTDVSYQRHDSTTIHIESNENVYFKVTITNILVVVVSSISLYLVVRWFFTKGKELKTDENHDECSVYQQNSRVHLPDTHNTFLLLTNQDFKQKWKSIVKKIRYRTALEITTTECHEVCLHSQRFHDVNWIQLQNDEKELKTIIHNTMKSLESWLKDNSLNHCHIHSAFINMSSLENLCLLHSDVLVCQTRIEQKHLSYVRSRESLLNLVRDKLRECGEVPRDMPLLITQESILLEALTLCEAAKLQSECGPAYTRVRDMLLNIREREDTTRLTEFESLCHRERSRLFHSFSVSEMDVGIPNSALSLHVSAGQCTSIEVKQEQPTANEMKQEQPTEIVAEDSIINKVGEHGIDHSVVESKQPSIPDSLDAFSTLNNTHTLPLHSVLIVEASRLHRELVSDFEQRKHAIITTRQEKHETARHRALKLIRRRQESVAIQTNLLDQDVSQRETMIEKENAAYMTLKAEIGNRHAVMKSWQSQLDLYVWVLTDILCVGAYSFTSTHCDKRKAYSQWSMNTMLTVCKHFSSSSAKVIGRGSTHGGISRICQLSRLHYAASSASDSASAAEGGGGWGIGSACDELSISYYFDSMIAPSLSIVTNSWHQLQRQINQGAYNALLSLFILPAEWRERVTVVSDSMSCLVSLMMYFFVPLLIARILIYFRLTSAASAFLIVSCLLSTYEVLLEALVSNIWLCGLIALHCVFHMYLHLFDTHLLWLIHFNVPRLYMKGYIIRVDMRWLVIYVFLPVTLWVASLLLGCAESLPESRGIKLSRSQCDWKQLIIKCFASVFLDLQCSALTC